MSSSLQSSSSKESSFGFEDDSFNEQAEMVNKEKVHTVEKKSQDEQLNLDWPLANNGSMVAYAKRLLKGHPREDEIIGLLSQRVKGDTPEVLLGELLRIMHADEDLKTYLPDLDALSQFAHTSAEQNIDSVVSDIDTKEKSVAGIRGITNEVRSQVANVFGLNKKQAETTLAENQLPLRLYLLGVLGRGGQGTVYSSYRDGEYRAIKLARGAGVTEIGRTKKEASILADKNHPAFLRMHEFRIVGSTMYMEIELAAGGSFGNLINPKLIEDEDYQLFGVMSAMKVAEGFQSIDTWYDDDNDAILHRDIKPDNILFSESGQPKITDFGLATKNNNSHTFTNTGEIMGTPNYMSPEVVIANDMKAYTPASEVYALGCTYFHYFAGQPPFSGSALQIFYKHKDEDPDYSLIPNKDVRELIVEMTLKDQSNRPTMGVVAERMKAIFMRSPMAMERKKFYRSTIENKETQLDPELLAYFHSRSGINKRARVTQQATPVSVDQVDSSVDFALGTPSADDSDSSVKILPFESNVYDKVSSDVTFIKNSADLESEETLVKFISPDNLDELPLVDEVGSNATETFIQPIKKSKQDSSSRLEPITDEMKKRLEEKQIRANSEMFKLIDAHITALKIGDPIGRTSSARVKAYLLSTSALQRLTTLAVLFGAPAIAIAGNNIVGSMRAERAEAAEVSLDTELAEWSSIAADDNPLSPEGLNAFRRELNAALARHPNESIQLAYVQAFTDEVPKDEYDVDVERNRVVELELLYNTHRQDLLNEVATLSKQLDGSASGLEKISFDRLNVLLQACRGSKYYNEVELIHAANSACSYQYNVVAENGALQMAHLEELEAGKTVLTQFDALVATLARRESPDDLIVQEDLATLHSLLESWEHRANIRDNFYKKGLQKLPSYAVLSQSQSGLIINNKVTVEDSITVVESKYATFTFDESRLASIQLPEDKMALKNLVYYKHDNNPDVIFSVESIGTDDMVKYRKNLLPFTEGKSAIRYKLYNLSNGTSPITIIFSTSIEGLLCVNRETGEIRRILETESLIRSKDVIADLIKYRDCDYNALTGYSSAPVSPPVFGLAKTVTSFLSQGAFPSAFNNAQLPDDMDRLEFLLQVQPHEPDEPRVAQKEKNVVQNQQ